MDGIFDVFLANLESALKIPNQRNILNILRSIIVKCEAENRLRSFFLFFFFFVSIMK